MSFESLHLSLSENSPEATAVHETMLAEHVGAEEAVRRILRRADHRNPGQRMIGLFSSDADTALIDEVMAVIEEGRRTQTTRNIGD